MPRRVVAARRNAQYTRGSGLVKPKACWARMSALRSAGFQSTKATGTLRRRRACAMYPSQSL